MTTGGKAPDRRIVRLDEDYPGQYVLNGDRVTGYQTACLAAGVWATRQHLNRREYLDVLRIGDGSELPVDTDWPKVGQKYPYVHVMWQNSQFLPTTLEEGREVAYADEMLGIRVDRCSLYRFEGSYLINIYAGSPFERAKVSDCVIGALGIDDRYRDLLCSNPYISIAPNMHTLAITSQSDSMGTPWDGDAMTCFCQMSFRCSGEFLYRVGDTPRFLTRIEVFADVDGGTWAAHVARGGHGVDNVTGTTASEKARES